MVNQKPAPFQRPGITIATTEKKEWRQVPVHSLREGDMVRDFGLLVRVSDSPKGLSLSFKSGTTLDIEEGETILAFVTV